MRARRIDDADTLPSQRPTRSWRTREDPLSTVWETEIIPLLRIDVLLNAVTLLEELQRRHPGQYDTSVLRTLQRRMRQWRAQHGAERDIYFAQEHPPGRLGLSDFTVCDALAVLIGGADFPHRLYQFALAHSGWRYAEVCVGGESFMALSSGLQAALWGLGGVPEEHRTDSLSAAFNNLAEQETLTRRYAELCRHYGMRASRCNPGESHENGSIESRHDSLKTALDQALRLRGSRAFDDLAGYTGFVEQIVQRMNQRTAKHLVVERATRAGQFEFDKDGNLVSRATGRQVMGLAADGKPEVISLTGLRISPPKVTTAVKFAGNLSSGATDFTLDSVKLVDAVGGAHVVKLLFKPKAGEAGTWSVTVVDGTTETAAGDLQFLAGTPVAGKDKLSFKFAPTGVASFDVALDFSQQVTSFSAGTTSTMAASSVDGQLVGTLTQVGFDASGALTLKYSNGASSTGPSLALATFESTAQLTQLGGGDFAAPGVVAAKLTRAGADTVGKVVSKQVEGSNVDLSSEFSDLIVMQRGYQASSRIVSTANEMLQDLFDMKGHR